MVASSAVIAHIMVIQRTNEFISFQRVLTQSETQQPHPGFEGGGFHFLQQ